MKIKWWNKICYDKLMNYLTRNDIIWEGLVEISHNILYIEKIRATIFG